MNFEKFAASKKSCQTAEEGFLFWSIDPRDPLPTELYSERENIVVHLLVEEGSLLCKVGEETLEIGPHTHANFIDRNQFACLSVTPTLRAYCVIFTDSYIQSLLANNPPLPFSYILHIRRQPVNALTDELFERIHQRMRYLGETAADLTHPLRLKQIRCAIWMLLLDIAAWHSQTPGSGLSNTKSDTLLQSFMHLLPAHIASEHSVSFYASTLCVTPQYLNRVVRALTGRTVSDWIDFTLTGEVTKLLDNSNLTIQTIARQLRFPDQATLSKFYKRHTGLTPSQRRQHE